MLNRLWAPRGQTTASHTEQDKQAPVAEKQERTQEAPVPEALQLYALYAKSCSKDKNHCEQLWIQIRNLLKDYMDFAENLLEKASSEKKVLVNAHNEQDNQLYQNLQHLTADGKICLQRVFADFKTDLENHTKLSAKDKFFLFLTKTSETGAHTKQLRKCFATLSELCQDRNFIESTYHRNLLQNIQRELLSVLHAELLSLSETLTLLSKTNLNPKAIQELKNLLHIPLQNITIQFFQFHFTLEGASKNNQLYKDIRFK